MGRFDLHDDPERARFHAILEQIERGRIADVTPEALAWFCDRTYRQEQRLHRLRNRLVDIVAEDTAMTPAAVVATASEARA